MEEEEEEEYFPHYQFVMAFLLVSEVCQLAQCRKDFYEGFMPLRICAYSWAPVRGCVIWLEANDRFHAALDSLIYNCKRSEVIILFIDNQPSSFLVYRRYDSRWFFKFMFSRSWLRN